MANWNVKVNDEPCISGYDYVSQLALPSPPASPPPVLGRLLSESPPDQPDPREMQVMVDNWMKTGQGAWVRYSVAGVQVAIELFVGGLRYDPDRHVRLSNAPIPPRGECTPAQLELVDKCEPTDPSVMEVRFARRLEYANSASGTCAGVLAGFGSSIALISNALALHQDPPIDACPVNMFVWIPNGEFTDAPSVSGTADWLVSESSACLLRGSTAAQLKGEGQVLHTGTCLSLGYIASMPPPFLAHPPPHPLHQSPSAPDALVPFPIVVFFVPALAILVGWLASIAVYSGINAPTAATVAFQIPP